MGKEIDIKMQRLQDRLSRMKNVAVALSGGVDSTLLAAVAYKILGDRVMTLTARSASHPAEESDYARKMADEIGVRHLFFESREMTDPEFLENSPTRCYHCKMNMFAAMRKLAADMGIEMLVHGANADDRKDFRPGFQAAQAMDFHAPLMDAGLTKAEIRMLAGKLGLSNADRPAMACLVTRIPYGVKITEEILTRIRRAERLVRSLGIGQCRVRDHDRLARIEIPPADIEMICRSDNRQKLVTGLRALGYDHISLDLEGYISGKMNRELSEK